MEGILFTYYMYFLWDNTTPVSYTHLDVYKRQGLSHVVKKKKKNIFIPIIKVYNIHYIDSLGIICSPQTVNSDKLTFVKLAVIFFSQLTSIFRKPCLLYTSRCV